MALVTDKHWVRHGASGFGWLAPASCVCIVSAEGASDAGVFDDKPV
jgi:hypothetical protein